MGARGGAASSGPRGPQLTTYMRKLLTDSNTGDLNRRGKEFVDKILRFAEDGTPRIITEILNRLEGKVPDRVVATVDYGPLTELTDEELNEIANGHEDDEPEPE